MRLSCSLFMTETLDGGVSQNKNVKEIFFYLPVSLQSVRGHSAIVFNGHY